MHPGCDAALSHLLGASLVEVDGDRALAWSDFVFVDRRGAVLSSGRYRQVIGLALPGCRPHSRMHGSPDWAAGASDSVDLW